MTRPVHTADLQDIMRAMLRVTPAERETCARQIIWRADVADRYRRAVKRPHPSFGNGTLSVAARSLGLADKPFRYDAEGLKCMQVFIETLLCGDP